MTATRARTLAGAGLITSLMLGSPALAGVPRTSDFFGLSSGAGVSIGKAASD